MTHLKKGKETGRKLKGKWKEREGKEERKKVREKEEAVKKKGKGKGKLKTVYFSSFTPFINIYFCFDICLC